MNTPRNASLAVQAAPLHPVQAAVQAAIARLAAFRPTRIVGEPDRADAQALADDLLVIAAIVDPIIAAIGDYADSTIGLKPEDVERDFRDQLRGALEGNATYAITAALAAREDHCADAAAEARSAMRRGEF